MAWPFTERIRPYIRMATYFLREGWTDEQIMQWAQDSPAHYNLNRMAESLPEARRAVYFAGRVEQRLAQVAAGGNDMRLSQLWGLSARSAWYAGYGRAPTQAEREWAYTRPQGVVGLTLEVTGRGAQSGRFQHYTITLNASWDTHVGALMDMVRQDLASGAILTGDMGSEPLDLNSINIAIGGGALLERQEPTIREVIVA